jgi:hypothetical protein
MSDVGPRANSILWFMTGCFVMAVVLDCIATSGLKDLSRTQNATLATRQKLISDIHRSLKAVYAAVGTYVLPQARGANFSLGAASNGSTSVTAPTRQTATSKLQVMPITGLTRSVSLSVDCGNTPHLNTCTTTPGAVGTAWSSSVPLTGTAGTAAGLLKPTARTGPWARPEVNGRVLSWLLAALALSLLMARCKAPARTHPLRHVALIVALPILMSLASCTGLRAAAGGGAPPPAGNGGGTIEVIADNYAGADICVKAANAIAGLPPTGGIVRFSAQNYAACASTLIVSKNNVTLKGAGKGSPFGSTGGTTLNFSAGVTGVSVTGDRDAIEELMLVSASSGSGTDDGIQLAGGGPAIRQVSVKHFGNRGLVFMGNFPNTTNFWHLEDVEANNNFGDGFQWAGPCTDNGVGFAAVISAANNGGWGFNLVCGQANEFHSTHASGNILGGWSVTGGNNYFFNIYVEADSHSSFVLQAGTAYNRVWFSNFGQPTTITDNGVSDEVFYGTGGFLGQNLLMIHPQPGVLGTNYALSSGALAANNLLFYDSTNGVSMAHYDPTTKWAFLQKVTFTPTSVVSGLNVGSLAGNPSSPSNGDIWYNSTAGLFECQQAGLTVPCIYSGGLTAKTNGTNNTSQSTSAAIQGTEAKILSSGTISGSAGAILCTDANGGATTSGCTSGAENNGVIELGGIGGIQTNLGSTTCYVVAAGVATSNYAPILLPYAGTVKNLEVHTSTVPASGTSLIFTVIDGVTSEPITCAIVGDGSLHTCSDTTHSFSASQGDAIALTLACSGTCGSQSSGYVTAAMQLQWEDGMKR